jgi:GNAT superfamily N-acetyltransferase
MSPRGGGALSAPEHIGPEHDLSSFESGVPALDEWLKRRALANEHRGASRTYVVRDTDNRVVGYYALATGSVAVEAATGRTRRNMPDPVPVMVLGRLAVHKDYQGLGIGRGLLRDAILRIAQAAEIGGIRAILVHAISEDAKRFYEVCGFHPSPLDPMTLMIPIADALRAMKASSSTRKKPTSPASMSGSGMCGISGVTASRIASLMNTSGFRAKSQRTGPSTSRLIHG